MAVRRIMQEIGKFASSLPATLNPRMFPMLSNGKSYTRIAWEWFLYDRVRFPSPTEALHYVGWICLFFLWQNTYSSSTVEMHTHILSAFIPQRK